MQCSTWFTELALLPILSSLQTWIQAIFLILFVHSLHQSHGYWKMSEDISKRLSKKQKFLIFPAGSLTPISRFTSLLSVCDFIVHILICAHAHPCRIMAIIYAVSGLMIIWLEKLFIYARCLAILIIHYALFKILHCFPSFHFAHPSLGYVLNVEFNAGNN